MSFKRVNNKTTAGLFREADTRVLFPAKLGRAPKRTEDLRTFERGIWRNIRGPVIDETTGGGEIGVGGTTKRAVRYVGTSNALHLGPKNAMVL